MTEERRAELNEIKARLQVLLIAFSGNDALTTMVNTMIAGIDNQLA